jgi:hypothetical protein
MEHTVVKSRASSALPAVQRIVDAAIRSGWPTKDAFECAMLLLAAGVGAVEAEEMFLDCRRRIQ